MSTLLGTSHLRLVQSRIKYIWNVIMTQVPNSEEKGHLWFTCDLQQGVELFLVLKNTAPSIEGLLVTSKPTEQRQALTICHIFKSMTHSFDEDFCEVRILSVVNGPKEHVLSSATVKTVEELKTIVKVWITDEHKRQIASTPPLREERKSTKQEKPIIKQQEKAVSKPTLPRAVTTGHIQRSQSSAAIEDNSPMFSRAHVKKLRESLGISAPTLVESPIDGKATSVLASARSCPTPRRNK